MPSYLVSCDNYVKVTQGFALSVPVLTTALQDCLNGSSSQTEVMVT